MDHSPQQLTWESVEDAIFESSPNAVLSLGVAPAASMSTSAAATMSTTGPPSASSDEPARAAKPSQPSSTPIQPQGQPADLNAPTGTYPVFDVASPTKNKRPLPASGDQPGRPMEIYQLSPSSIQPQALQADMTGTYPVFDVASPPNSKRRRTTKPVLATHIPESPALDAPSIVTEPLVPSSTPRVLGPLSSPFDARTAVLHPGSATSFGVSNAFPNLSPVPWPSRPPGLVAAAAVANAVSMVHPATMPIGANRMIPSTTPGGVMQLSPSNMISFPTFPLFDVTGPTDTMTMITFAPHSMYRPQMPTVFPVMAAAQPSSPPSLPGDLMFDLTGPTLPDRPQVVNIADYMSSSNPMHSPMPTVSYQVPMPSLPTLGRGRQMAPHKQRHQQQVLRQLHMHYQSDRTGGVRTVEHLDVGVGDMPQQMELLPMIDIADPNSDGKARWVNVMELHKSLMSPEEKTKVAAEPQQEATFLVDGMTVPDFEYRRRQAEVKQLQDDHQKTLAQAIRQRDGPLMAQISAEPIVPTKEMIADAREASERVETLKRVFVEQLGELKQRWRSRQSSLQQSKPVPKLSIGYEPIAPPFDEVWSDQFVRYATIDAMATALKPRTAKRGDGVQGDTTSEVGADASKGASSQQDGGGSDESGDDDEDKVLSDALRDVTRMQTASVADLDSASMRVLQLLRDIEMARVPMYPSGRGRPTSSMFYVLKPPMPAVGMPMMRWRCCFIKDTELDSTAADVECGQSFNKRSALIRHLRTHTGDRPFQCPFDGCNMNFAEKGNLKRHYKIHTGERAFVCPVVECAQAFARKTHLQHHVNSHHREIADMLPASSLAPIKRPIFVSGINQSARSRKVAAATAGATNQYSAAAISTAKPPVVVGAAAQSSQVLVSAAETKPESVVSADPAPVPTTAPSAPSASPVTADVVLAAAAVLAEPKTHAPATVAVESAENTGNSDREVASQPASTPSDMLMRLSTVATLSTQPSKAAEEAQTVRRSARSQSVTPGLAKLLQSAKQMSTRASAASSAGSATKAGKRT